MNKNRIYYLDNLKILLIVLVIMHHAAHGYGNIHGTWIYTNRETCDVLYYFILVNASFFMGLFFMISGYFVPKSLSKYNLSDFIKKKAKRLMLPVLFILSVVVPSYFYIAACYKDKIIYNFFSYYIDMYWKSGKFSYEHGWFIVNLFIYTVLFAVISTIFKKISFKINKKISICSVILLGIIIGCIFKAVRIFYDLDDWIAVFGIIGMEPAHVFQYIIFFSIGILAYYNDWFNKITPLHGRIYVVLGSVMVFITYMNKYLPERIWNFIWQNWSFYEAFMGIFISFGLIYLFREKLNKSNSFVSGISRCSYGAYIVHIFFIVVIQILIDTLNISPINKFIIVSLAAVILSYLNVYFYKKIKKSIEVLINDKIVPKENNSLKNI